MVKSYSPLWRQIRDELAAEVRRGRYVAGELLPTEQLLCERFGVHRHTIRRALQELRDLGLTRTTQGRGTVVLEQPLEDQGGRRARIREDLSLSSLQAGSRCLCAELINSSETVARRLDLTAGAPVVYLETVGEADGKPLYVSSLYIPYAGREQIVDILQSTSSLNEYFGNATEQEQTRKLSCISTRMANTEEVRHLRLRQKRPLLVVEYVNVDGDGRPIEFGIARLCGDRMALVVPGT